MAKRIATEYVKATMRLSEEQMDQFTCMMCDPQDSQKTEMMGSSSALETLLVCRDGEGVLIPVTRVDGGYICACSFRLHNPRLTHDIWRMFSEFKGSGQVNRIYEGYMMMYLYKEGRVVQITEQTTAASRIVYEQRDYAEELGALFARESIETEILNLRLEIDRLLDTRLHLVREGLEDLAEIDFQLSLKVLRLHDLEA